jgi:predicted  nucleic acid-binding Zn-ribbon protein
MCLKLVKYGLLGAVGTALVGGAIFGRDAVSYLSSGARSIQTAVKSNVPIEFELKRARDLVEDIVPEMHANIRLIAQQEVEINALRGDIERSSLAVAEERARVARLRECLGTSKTSFTFGNLAYSREQVKDELARSFDQLKEAEVVLAGKQRLLENRQKSLAAAVQVLERTRSQKATLEAQIASLESQHRLIQASAVGTHVGIDNSKLAKTEKLLSEIRKQLEVAERVLAHESRFVAPIGVEGVNESDLVAQVDEHIGQPEKRASR